LHKDVQTEADWLAEQVAALLRGERAGAATDPDGRDAPVTPQDAGHSAYAPREIAILARKRSLFDRVEEALRARGIPVEVSGLGGLLATPEVADIVAVLRVLSDPGAGHAAVRLLTGARWRIGPRDLDALGRRARRLARPDDETAAAALEAEPDEVDQRSLVEAIDDLGPQTAYSDAGFRRLSAIRAELRGLRRRADQSLPDLVADVIRTARLDVEVAARPGVDPASARGHLDRFLDVAADFAETEEDPTLSSFLGYLEAAEEYERGLDTGRVGVPGDAVQLLTMHGAKGLEWPVVFIPGLTREVFPGRPQERSDWTANAKALPFPLRGDAADLPTIDVSGCNDQEQLRDALRRHGQDCADRDALEERRLMYVAATRAEQLLMLSGYWWDHTTKPRGPSAFLEEIRATCQAMRIGTEALWAAQPTDGDRNPLDVGPREHGWPYDPLSPQRRSALDEGVDRVRRALETGPGPSTPAQLELPIDAGDGGSAADELDEELARRLQQWQVEVEQLLAEQARRRWAGQALDVLLPGHLSVSQLVALRRDPDELARRIRRPVPVPPTPLARRGTAFHTWLEQRFEGGRLLDLDELPGSADGGAAPDEDSELLKASFLGSEWAGRAPVPGGIEVPFEMVVEGVLVRGRMDAVFGTADGGYDVIDWKTGQRPTGTDAEAAAVQLAAYRLAWHRLSGVPLEAIRAGFHYVRTGETVRPADLLDEAGLTALVAAVPLAIAPE
jgi:DNA helicase-2/ATP-dependent DNA helicase PcrA